MLGISFILLFRNTFALAIDAASMAVSTFPSENRALEFELDMKLKY